MSPSSLATDFGPLQGRNKREILGNIKLPLSPSRMSGSATVQTLFFFYSLLQSSISSDSLYVCLSVSLCLYVSLAHSLPLAVTHSVSLSLSLSRCLSLSLFLWLTLSLAVTLSVSLLSLSLCLCLSLSVVDVHVC